MKTLIVLLLTSVMAMGQAEVTKTITGRAVVMPNGTKATEWEKDFVKIIAKISNKPPMSLSQPPQHHVQKQFSLASTPPEPLRVSVH